MTIIRRISVFASLAFIAFLMAETGAFAQAICGISSVPTLVRSRGLTEQTGTIMIGGCTGTIGAGGANLTVSIQPATANITNSPAATPTAVVSTTTGGVTSVTAVVAGTISANTVSFAIPATPGGATLASIQVGVVSSVPASVAIRVNASASGIIFPGQISVLLTASPAGTLALTNNVANVAMPLPGLYASTTSGAGIYQASPPALTGVPQTSAFASGAIPSFTATDTVTALAVAASSIPIVSAAEGFASALLVAGVGIGEGVDGSGIGTRVLIRIPDLPANISIYAPQVITTTTAGGTLTLTLVLGADTNGNGGVVIAGPSATTANLISGTAVTYETTASSNGLTEGVAIPLGLFTTGTPSAGEANVKVYLAPVSSIGTAVAIGTAPIPRFADTPADLLTSPGAPSISLSSTSLVFNVPVASTVSSQLLAIKNGGGGTLNWTATTSYISGGNWLMLSSTSGTGDSNVLLSVNTASLPTGSYTATVLVSAQGATNSPQSLTVTLNVTPTVLYTTPSSLSFSGPTGRALPSQQLTISTDGALNWTATASASGGNWLTLSAASGVTRSTIDVFVNTAGLASGGYQGTITVTAPGAANSPLIVKVDLTVSAPLLSQGGIVNSASYTLVISPGSIASIFGSGLAGTTGQATTTPLPTILAGTQVLVNEVPAPLFYVLPTQINFEVPPGISGSTVQVAVVSNGVRGLTSTVNITSLSPGIFTVSGSGSGQAAVLNQDSSLNSAQNPALPGSVIQIFATGLGATNPAAIAGQAAGTSPLSVTLLTPTVLIGGIQAVVTYAGLAPGLVGVYQVNARIPAGTASSGAVPLQIVIGTAPNGVGSNVVTIAVR